ncbi:MAG: hypothetical protein IPK80_19280 [Nannocystis sp.]|nr:hypothetical protein [Nannocystis sp.]
MRDLRAVRTHIPAAAAAASLVFNSFILLRSSRATPGEVLSVEFTVQGDVTGSIDHGQIVIESLEILSWPLELKLADASGACQAVD